MLHKRKCAFNINHNPNESSHCSLLSISYLFYNPDSRFVFQLNGEGKFDADKTIEILVEVVKNYDDYKALETVVKSCASG